MDEQTTTTGHPGPERGAHEWSFITGPESENNELSHIRPDAVAGQSTIEKVKVEKNSLDGHHSDDNRMASRRYSTVSDS